MKNPFKKEKKLLYRFHDESLNEKEVAEDLIQDILVKATPKSSKWWASLPSNVRGYKDYFQHLREVHKGMFNGEDVNRMSTITTAKSCPGILGMFDKAFLVKSPCDIFITVDDAGNWVYNSANNLVTVSMHNDDQFYGYGNELFENKISLKILIEIDIEIQGADDYMLDHPSYHNNLDFLVTKGFVSGKFNRGMQLNIITLIDLPPKGEKKEIAISAGDVLAYLIPSEYNVKLEFSKHDFVKHVRRNRWKIKLGY